MAKALSDVVKALRLAKDTPSIEEALKGVVAESEGDASTRLQLCTLLDSVLADESRWNVNAKLRRKLKRTLEVYGESTSNQTAAALLTEDVAGSSASAVAGTATLDWDALARAVRAARSAEELESMLVGRLGNVSGLPIYLHALVYICMSSISSMFS
ncbi:hypothetical protein EON64_12670 [archaeon]|nr:MAG: hypothetical protein EON64_12670 [archaeon]